MPGSSLPSKSTPPPPSDLPLPHCRLSCSLHRPPSFLEWTIATLLACPLLARALLDPFGRTGKVKRLIPSALSRVATRLRQPSVMYAKRAGEAKNPADRPRLPFCPPTFCLRNTIFGFEKPHCLPRARSKRTKPNLWLARCLACRRRRSKEDSKGQSKFRVSLFDFSPSAPDSGAFESKREEVKVGRQ